MKRWSIMSITALATVIAANTSNGASYPGALPGELTADEILNGTYAYPPSPQFEVSYDAEGLAAHRVTPVPAPGVHPRILLSPQDLPDLRQRLSTTVAGREMKAVLRQRIADTIEKSGSWEAELYQCLTAGDGEAVSRILNSRLKPSSPPGHYQPHIIYALVMKAFEALLDDDVLQQKQVGSAIATYAALLEQPLQQSVEAPLAEDVWRSKVAGAATGNWTSDQGLRDLMGGHLLGYAYDFAHVGMTDAQRDQVRRVIAKATSGRVFMGAQIPHHFRNWNWIAVAMQQPLLALAIEGEEGYDPRVYRLGVEIMRDYLTYGISPSGSSTEAVGYTQFGLVWGNPFIVAATRRGDRLLMHSHHRAMLEWYVHSMDPVGGVWTSHGDGGDSGPALWTAMMWKYFYPDDARADFVYQQVMSTWPGKPYSGRYHIIEPMIFASDPSAGADGKPLNHAHGAALGLTPTFFDPLRSSLITRSDWSPDAMAAQFECRTDSVGPSHEHADRGNFTLAALGRQWARESFRSVETRHHNNVLVDGMGQGYWPGPGKWLGLEDGGWAIVAACDAKDAYDWWWPKQIIVEDPDTFERFKYLRWADYKLQAEQFRKEYGAGPFQKDTRPAVVAHYKGYEQGDPRMWDEDGWPDRLPHNPVQKAFRTIVVVRNPHPYLIVIDDIQKDEQVRLYEWGMMTGPDTDVAKIGQHELVLCDASVKRGANGLPKPGKGDRQLLVKVLDATEPAEVHAYQSKPSIRLEVFEKRDTTTRDGRTFGLDRRLVIPSRSASPQFKILLAPYRNGEPAPEANWNEDRTQLTVKWPGQTDTFTFTVGPDGRTRVTAARENATSVTVK